MATINKLKVDLELYKLKNSVFDTIPHHVLHFVARHHYPIGLVFFQFIKPWGTRQKSLSQPACFVIQGKTEAILLEENDI